MDNQQKTSISEYLKKISYPGRGIIFGCAGDRLITAYFITGRSESSKSRRFIETPDGIETAYWGQNTSAVPLDLLVYRPVKLLHDKLIVTNGNQTDIIHEYLTKKRELEDALQAFEYEPDAPHFTPRISGIAEHEKYKLSIVRKVDGGIGRACYTYNNPEPGTGHIIHTYMDGGSSLPSFSGDPVAVRLPGGNIDDIADAIWSSLNGDYRVALYVALLHNGVIADKRLINH